MSNNRTYLNVPYAEKDAAKALGARWDQHRKSWFVPGGQDTVPFSKWLFNEENAKLRAFGPIYLLKSWERCWKCANIADVFCLSCFGIADRELQSNHFFHLSNLRHPPEEITLALKVKAPLYFPDSTKMSNSIYYVNHCTCGAKLGDFFMHNEPEGAFTPINEEQASQITMSRITSNDIVVSASYGTDDTRLIPNHAQRDD